MKEKGPLTILAREAFLTASYASLTVLGIALLGKWAEKVVGYLGGFQLKFQPILCLCQKSMIFNLSPIIFTKN